MSTILFISGTTRGDALGCIIRGIAKNFERLGFETIEVNLMKENVFKSLEATLREKDVLFALSYAGIGRDILIDDAEGKKRVLWELLGIPYISIHGDSPAYFFDRHVNTSDNYGTVYSFREHYDLRKRLPHADIGLFGVQSPLIFDSVPKDQVDFKAKESGKLIFLKNSSDPNKVVEMWQKKCRPTMYQMLAELADVLVGDIASGEEPDIDELVTGYFKLKGIDIDAMTNLRLFFDAQLDDYLRRVKCTFMAEILKEFPVEIHGDNWEYMDFSNSPCKLVPTCDYVTSRGIIERALGVIDMSPNTGNGFHDRPMRAYGRHTLCLTNEQHCVTDVFGADNGMTFRFDRDSIANKLADVIAHPKDYIEIGIEAARIFNDRFANEESARAIVEMADAMRMSMMKYNPNMQDYFVWPPKMLTPLKPTVPSTPD